MTTRGPADPNPELPSKDEMISGVLNELQRHFRVLKRTVQRAMPKQDADGAPDARASDARASDQDATPPKGISHRKDGGGGSAA